VALCQSRGHVSAEHRTAHAHCQCHEVNRDAFEGRSLHCSADLVNRGVRELDFDDYVDGEWETEDKRRGDVYNSADEDALDGDFRQEYFLPF